MMVMNSHNDKMSRWSNNNIIMSASNPTPVTLRGWRRVQTSLTLLSVVESVALEEGLHLLSPQHHCILLCILLYTILWYLLLVVLVVVFYAYGHIRSSQLLALQPDKIYCPQPLVPLQLLYASCTKSVLRATLQQLHQHSLTLLIKSAAS